MGYFVIGLITGYAICVAIDLLIIKNYKRQIKDIREHSDFLFDELMRILKK